MMQGLQHLNARMIAARDEAKNFMTVLEATTVAGPDGSRVVDKSDFYTSADIHAEILTQAAVDLSNKMRAAKLANVKVFSKFDPPGQIVYSKVLIGPGGQDPRFVAAWMNIQDVITVPESKHDAENRWEPGETIPSDHIEKLRSAVRLLELACDDLNAPGSQSNDVQHAGAVECDITVTDAAKLLVKDIGRVKLSTAKARVSRAADRGEIRTNGKQGAGRRLHPDSVDAWRLRERDKDAASDKW